jgi:hypothetical protein
MRIIVASSSSCCIIYQTRISKVSSFLPPVIIYLECLFLVEEGDRVAQLILEKIYNPEVLEVAVSLSVEVLSC